MSADKNTHCGHLNSYTMPLYNILHNAQENKDIVALRIISYNKQLFILMAVPHQGPSIRPYMAYTYQGGGGVKSLVNPWSVTQKKKEEMGVEVACKMGT